MPSGRIKKLNVDKGYGFLTPDVKGPDCFFHHSVVADRGFNDLEEGQAVTYTISTKNDGGKGPKAESVSPV